MESHGPKPTINNVARSPTAVPPNGKASRSSSRAFLLLLPLIVLPCVVQLAYTDFWMHAAAGRWILENRAIPHQNIFTYTAREHPFIDHTWLSQVVLYLCWLIGEVPAVRIFQIALVVLSFATLWRFWIRQGAPASLGLVVFSTAIFVSAPRFSPRPELFAAVGIALYLTHLYEFAQARRRHLWWLPAYMLLWVNAHGGMLTGLIIIAAFLCGQALDALRQRTQRRAAGGADSSCGGASASGLRHISAVMLTTTLVTFINPYGAQYYSALNPARLKIFTYQLTEWWSLLRAWPSMDLLTQTIIVVLGVVTAVCIVCRKERFSRSSALLFLAACYLLYTARRQVWTFAQICMVIIAVQTSGLPSVASLPVQLRRLGTAVACLVLGAMTFHQYARLRQAGIPLGLSVFWEDPPKGAADFIEKHTLQLRMYNYMDDGGYLAWQLYPQNLLFIDQLNACGTDLLQWDDKMVDGREIQSVVDHFNFDSMIITNEYFNSGLVQYLANSSDWAMVYWDAVSCLYLRRIPAFSEIIASDEYRALVPHGYRTRRGADNGNAIRAETERAISSGIETAALHITTGKLRLRMGETRRARTAFSRAAQLNPWDSRAFSGLATVCLLEGNDVSAARYATRALALNPRWSLPWKTLAQTHMHREDHRRAAKCLMQATRFASPADDAHRSLGLLLFQLNENKRSVEHLTIWLRSHPEDLDARFTLAQAYGSAGYAEQAREVFREITVAFPGHAPAWYGLASMEAQLGASDAAINALSEPIRLDSRMRSLAQSDTAFASIRAHPEYRKLTQ